ncbi:MAG: hypothetical protein WBZ37_27095 [Mycobacterium sp.]
MGSVAAFGHQFQDAPLLTLIVPLPALGLLIVFVVNSFNQALRDVSSRSLETLLHGATSGYLPNWTIDMLAKSAQGLEEGMPTPLPDEAKALDPKHFRDSSAPLREIVIGLTATDHFYNRHRANKHHKWFLRIYSVLTGFLVVTGMVLVLCYGLHQVIWGHNATTWHLGTVDDYVPRGRSLYRASGHVVLGGIRGNPAQETRRDSREDPA